METVTTDHGLSRLAKWGIGLALGALLLPVLGLIAVGMAITLLIRSEVGPGLAVLVLSPITTLFGIGLALGLGV